MIPVGNWMLVAMMQAPTMSASGLHLVDDRKANDAIVLIEPEGRILNNGGRYPIEIQSGDRVVAGYPHFREWQDHEAFIRIEDVVARMPGPHWREIQACGPYVLVIPDLIPRLHQRESGVLVSHVRLRGGDSRDLERGERLFQEFNARAKFLRTQTSLVPAERQDILRKEYLDLPVCDREALKEAMAAEGDTGYKRMRPPSSATEPRRGQVVSVGPGRVKDDGTREAPVGISCGMRVHWEKSDRDGRTVRPLELWDGRRALYALDWRVLSAVEIQNAEC